MLRGVPSWGDIGLCRKFSYEAIWGRLSPSEAEGRERSATRAISFTGAPCPQESMLRGGPLGGRRALASAPWCRRLTRPRLGCRIVDAAPGTVAGGARRPRSQNRQLGGEAGLTTAARCYSLAASAPYSQGPRLLHDLLSKIGDTTSAGPVALSLAIIYEEVRQCRVTFTLPYRTITR
jgi:hypothetical protein